MDCVQVLTRHFSIAPQIVWHQSQKLPKLDAVVIPGGFSFGDYLRSGALAAHTDVMKSVQDFCAAGGAVLGICNGFQVLVEAKILPGMLLHNTNLKFICRPVYLRDFEGNVLEMPIAHGEGRYYADQKTLDRLEEKNLIAYKYCDKDGRLEQTSNPNGSLRAIAGVYSENKRVLGMMPHPERATDIFLGGSSDGLKTWSRFLETV
jgi:phosphoribosylformylglycinamidine synthase